MGGIGGSAETTSPYSIFSQHLGPVEVMRKHTKKQQKGLKNLAEKRIDTNR